MQMQWRWVVLAGVWFSMVHGVSQADALSSAAQPSASASASSSPQRSAAEQLELEKFGRMLFFDPSLSLTRGMACSGCHNPAQAFIDHVDNGTHRAVSLGDDKHSLGDRNAPTVTYASFSPPFHKDEQGRYVGGQFWDGRAATLAEQAGGPPLNPIEMAMPDKASVWQRLLENPIYVRKLESLFGKQAASDAEAGYQAMTQSIEAFEQSAFMAPFDSKYDRYLRGEYQMTAQEELGRTLFFSQQFTNCNQCHQLRSSALAEQETFSNYQYHNIGVPKNVRVRAMNGLGDQFVDQGLLDNPQVDDPAQRGKFKVPTLRNVAVTGPYMHNGVFQDLRTVILFYNKYNSKSARSQINPETGLPWGQPEVTENLSLKELESGPALDNRRVDALAAFLKTLTDKRYEALLEQQESTQKKIVGQ